MMGGSVHSEERDRKGQWGKNKKEQDKKKTQIWFSSYLSCWIIAHTGSFEERIKPLQLVFDRTSSYYHHCPTPVLVGSLGHPPVVCGCMRVCHSSEFKKKKVGHWFVCREVPPTLMGWGQEGAHHSSRMTLTKLATSVSLESCTVKNGCCCIKRSKKQLGICS